METKTLKDDDKVLFLMMQGFATGAAIRNGDRDLALKFLALTNKLNSDNPNFIPYRTVDDITELYPEAGSTGV
jgi:hypothetical protein